MANPDHVEVVKQGADAISSWRKKNPTGVLNLSGANLSGAHLSDANLSDAALTRAHLRDANLSGAALTGADLIFANLTRANLTGATLTSAALIAANLTGATLSGADFQSTKFGDTTFADVDLSGGVNLERSEANGPSTVGTDTILKSGGKIPDEFLRSCGVNPLIQRLLVGTNMTRTDAFYDWIDLPIKLDTCFISYSTKDKPFVDRLRGFLNKSGVDYWYAPEHGESGRKLTEQIDRQITLRDRVILVCSAAALNESDWVQWEIEKTIAEEKRRNKTILFPIMLDDALLNWDHPRAVHIREILAGDFRKATRGKAFENRADRLLRALYDR